MKLRQTNKQTAKSHSYTPYEKQTDDNSNPTENNTESLQDETSVEQSTNPTNNTLQKPLQIPESSYSEIYTEQRLNPYVELQHRFSEVFSPE